MSLLSSGKRGQCSNSQKRRKCSFPLYILAPKNINCAGAADSFDFGPEFFVGTHFAGHIQDDGKIARNSRRSRTWVSPGLRSNRVWQLAGAVDPVAAHEHFDADQRRQATRAPHRAAQSPAPKPWSGCLLPAAPSRESAQPDLRSASGARRSYCVVKTIPSMLPVRSSITNDAHGLPSRLRRR